MKNQQPILLGILLLFLFMACQNKQETPSQKFIPNPQALDKILDKYIDEGYYPFVYARLEDLDGKVIYEHSKVNQDLVPNIKIDGDMWFRIWSMSKIITISVALDLIEEGIINFEDPVVKYIPEFENLKVAVTTDGQQLAELAWGERDPACPYQLEPLDSVMTVLHLINLQVMRIWSNYQMVAGIWSL